MNTDGIPASQVAGYLRSAYYRAIRAKRPLTVEEVIAARPDLHPLQAIAAEHRPIAVWVAEQERAEAAAALRRSSASAAAPATG